MNSLDGADWRDISYGVHDYNPAMQPTQTAREVANLAVQIRENIQDMRRLLDEADEVICRAEFHARRCLFEVERGRPKLNKRIDGRQSAPAG